MKKRIYIALLPLLLLAGCHSSRKATSTPPPVVEEPPVEAPKRVYTVVTFEGEVEGVAVNGQLRMAQDSVMWLSVSKLIELGRALATPDSLWLRAPLMNRDEAMDYAGLRRQTGVTITFDEMQQTVLADDAEARLARLAQQLGFSATVRITGRRQVEHLSFPYTKPVKRP